MRGSDIVGCVVNGSKQYFIVESPKTPSTTGSATTGSASLSDFLRGSAEKTESNNLDAQARSEKRRQLELEDQRMHDLKIEKGRSERQK